MARQLPARSVRKTDAQSHYPSNEDCLMRLYRRSAAFFLVVAGLMAASSAFAQYGPNVSQRIRCESNDQRTVTCGADTRDGVILVRQLSRGTCIEGRTWGWNRRGVWVSQGCRAEFEIGGYRGDGHFGPGQSGSRPGAGQRVRCESNDGRTNYCDIDSRGGVVLVRQLSRGACIEGRTWGSDRRGVWVSQGCRAEFEARGGGWGGPGNGTGWGGGVGGHGGVAQSVRCESQDGRTQYCDIGRARDVRLERQLSRGACIEGRTWGWDRRGIWVSNGCRADFTIL